MTDTLDLGKRLRMAFYEASDGPWIMLWGPMDAEFGKLQSTFFWLSEHPGHSVAIHDLPFIASFGGLEVAAIASSMRFTHRAGPQGIRRVSNTNDLHFSWQRNAQGWDYLGHLIDGVVSKAKACHQYLTRYPDEDAIVILSKGEYDDSALVRLGYVLKGEMGSGPDM
jgi:hypothetical protein